jgi:dipeptidyl aminopeptidase/acylaminoacyl peptidase
MTQHDDARITDWLAEGKGHGRGTALDAALAEARSTNQRPGWVVSLTSGTIAEPRAAVLLRHGILVLGAALLIGLLLGGLATGGMLPLRLPPQPVPSALALAPNATAGPSPRLDGSPSPASSSDTPSSAPATGLVAYSVVECATPTDGIRRCSTTPWLAAANGRDARAIQGTSVVGWSADGSKLVVLTVNDTGGAVSLIVVDPAGDVVATIDVPCTSPVIDEKYGGHLCPDQGEFAVSPDGTRVAFTRTDSNVDDSSVLSILDLSTGHSIALAATRTTNPPAGQVCNTSTKTHTCQGFDGSPRWSPDGRSIAFERQLMAPESGAPWDSAAVFVVDADGTNFRRVTPSSVHGIGPAWSQDGTRLAFDGSDMVLNARGTSVLDIKDDVYTIGVDGSGLARLTHDGISSLPDWTSGGRVAFVRNAASTNSENWIMDADGGNQSRLGGSLADLTAAGCTTCVYVAHEPAPGALPRAYWQPLP